tara:strand:+ start:246 stop:506 length:261 start_codon:yes stop_codon:yes gene_type:complete
MEGVVNNGPFLSIIASLITWTMLIIVLCIFKNFIVRGASLAFAELLRTLDVEQLEKYLRWLTNRDQIEQCLKDIRDRNEGPGRKSG